MLDKTRPMTLGDIFSNAFDLIKATFTRNIIIAAVFLIPTGILMAYGLQSYFNIVFNAAQLCKLNGTEGISAAQTSGIVLSFLFFFFSLIVFFLGYLGAWIGITRIGCSSIEGNKISLSEAFQEIFSTTFLRCIGQMLLMMLAFGALFLSIVIIMVITQIGHIRLVILFGILSLFAGIGFAIFLYIRWYFASVNIVYKHEGVMDAFSRSWHLVKGYWWRTFGIILLISIIVGFASTVVSTPITFIFEWDFISQYFKLMTGESSGTSNPTVLFGLMKSLGFTYGLIIALTSILHMLVYPLFQIVLYFDLIIRKNDFHAEINPESELTLEEPII